MLSYIHTGLIVPWWRHPTRHSSPATAVLNPSTRSEYGEEAVTIEPTEVINPTRGGSTAAAPGARADHGREPEEGAGGAREPVPDQAPGQRSASRPGAVAVWPRAVAVSGRAVAGDRTVTGLRASEVADRVIRVMMVRSRGIKILG
jgi:hypothetical protein